MKKDEKEETVTMKKDEKEINECMNCSDCKCVSWCILRCKSCRPNKNKVMWSDLADSEDDAELVGDFGDEVQSGEGLGEGR